MKYTWRIGEIPDGDTPLDQQSVVVRSVASGATLRNITTDDDGFVTLQADGHYEPFYLHLQGVPGGDKYWRSDESHAVGAYSPKELPVAMRVAGDGVIRGYGSELAVALSGGGPSVTVASGGANVAGHPFVQYTTSTTFSISRPVTSTRIDRVIIRLYPEGSATTPGKADPAILAGVEGSAATALTQSATVHEISLASVTIPTAGAVTLTDERTWATETPPAAGETRSTSESTTNVSGEALTNLNTNLVLPRTATYDVEAWVSAIQDNGGGWVEQAGSPFGSLGAGTSPNFSSPAQVAVNSGNKPWIADTGNGRAVRLTSGGAHDDAIAGLTNVTGIAVDASDNIYVAYGNTLRKFNSSLVSQWSVIPAITTLTHVATDGTHVFVTDKPGAKVWKRLCSDGSAVTSWGLLGGPWGIAYSASELYIVTSLLSRVSVHNTSGVFQRNWSIPANCRGITADASGDLWVAVNGSDELRQYDNTGTLLTTLAQSTPEGIGVATGDVLWVSSTSGHNIAKWDEAAAGYGGLAVEIDSNLGTYITLGDLDGMLQNSHTRTATGPATISVKAYAKATSGTATFRSIVLSAKAVPRS